MSEPVLIWSDGTQSVRVQLKCKGCGVEFDIPLSDDPQFKPEFWELCLPCQRERWRGRGAKG